MTPRQRKSKSAPDLDRMSRRTRQVMDILYRLGEASASDILAAAGEDIPSYSAVRSILRQLVSAGHVVYEERGPRYVYRPSVPRHARSRSALAHVLETFFDGSPQRTMKALLGLSSARDEAVLDELEEMIRQARKEGR